MLWILVFIFGASLVAAPLHRLLGALSGAVLSLVPAIALGGFLWVVETSSGEPVERYEWLPALGIELAFLVDGLALLFGVLVLGIGFAVLVYSAAYMRHEERLGSFFTRMLFFTGSMFGLVLADDLASLYVFWEMTTVASFFLIGWHPEERKAREAARSALLVTAAGGLVLMAAFVAMAIAAGPVAGGSDALRISSLNALGLQGHASYAVIVVLVLLAAMAKSAQAPLWFWLPAAMEAPTPVSAYLHSATMVKAGVFLLARFSPALGGTALWTWLLTLVGGVTMVLAGLGAIGQSDLKRLLAFSTISILGAIVFLLGMGSQEAVAAAVVLIVAHALYKAALFLVAGSVEKASGTRDLGELGGLARHVPLVAATAVLAAASLAALPPLLGYVAKEKLYAAAQHDLGGLGLAVSLLGGLTMVAAALLCGYRPFFGRCRVDALHAVPAGMTVPPFILAVLGLSATFFPGPLRGWMTGAASAISGAHHTVALSLWPGSDAAGLTVLAASAVTFVAGFFVYRLRERRLVELAVCLGDGAVRWSDALAKKLGGAVMRAVKPLTRLHQSGRLLHYLRTILATTALAAGVPLLFDVGRLAGGLQVTWLEASILAMIVFGALGAVTLARSLGAVASLGMAGIGIALFFAVFSAPDLAITQVMVEALIVVLFVLCFYRLDPEAAPESRAVRLGDAALAVAVGAVVTLLVLAATTLPLEPDVAESIAQASVPQGEGRNVVNVILVEVRSLDTLGEVTVLGTAGLGVLVLLRGREAHS